MPTQNRRVATYLPKEIDDRLKAFITERNLKGESQALIAILSEYFEVAHPSTQQLDYSGFVKIEQFQELADKVSALAEQIERGSSVGGLLSKLPDKMRQMAERLEKVEASAILAPSVEPSPTPEPTKSVPGQMDLLNSVESSSPGGMKGELDSEEASSIPSETTIETTIKLSQINTGDTPSSSNSELKAMTDTELATRFRMSNPKSLANRRSMTRDKPDEFVAWSKGKDPDGIPWRYDLKTKLYHPIVNSSPVSLSESPV